MGKHTLPGSMRRLLYICSSAFKSIEQAIQYDFEYIDFCSLCYIIPLGITQFIPMDIVGEMLYIMNCNFTLIFAFLHLLIHHSLNFPLPSPRTILEYSSCSLKFTWTKINNSIHQPESWTIFFRTNNFQHWENFPLILRYLWHNPHYCYLTC